MKTFLLSLVVASALTSCGDGNNQPLNNNTESSGTEQNAISVQNSSLSLTVRQQIVNPSDESGNWISGWECKNQDGIEVMSFAFSDDGTGSVLDHDDAPSTNITWSESANNSILLSLVSSGDSQLQTITFSDPTNFSTTDSSILGVALGPLNCKLDGLPNDALSEGQEEPVISNSVVSAILPPEFHNIWFIYNSNSGARWTAMTFTNGSITTAVNDTIELGVSASRQKVNNVNKWGTYETTDAGEQLVVQFPNWKEPRKYHITDRSIRMTDNFKLTGCFSVQNISTLGIAGVVGSTTFSSSTYCFDPNGRFSNDSSVAISVSAPNSLGTSTGQDQGTYQIKGNTITLNYSNGNTLQTVFGAYRFGEPAPTLTAISIGQQMFF